MATHRYSLFFWGGALLSAARLCSNLDSSPSLSYFGMATDVSSATKLPAGLALPTAEELESVSYWSALEAMLVQEIQLLDEEISKVRACRSELSATPDTERKAVSSEGGAAEAPCDPQAAPHQAAPLSRNNSEVVAPVAALSSQGSSTIEPEKASQAAPSSATSGSASGEAPRDNPQLASSTGPQCTPPPLDTCATNSAVPTPHRSPVRNAEEAQSHPSSASTPTGSQSTVRVGYLMNYGKRGFFRSFNLQFIVVDESGVRWYRSNKEYTTNPSAMLDAIPWFVEATNSRGSRFKHAAVCFPVVTKEDCPKATDPNKTYFGIQYMDNQRFELLVLAANTPQERDDWCYHITKYVKLHIPFGEEFQQYAHMKVGAATPLHLSHAIEGEAPGGATPASPRN